MKIFEILSFNRELLRRLSEVGIKPNDYAYIDLYNDYSKLRSEGYKVTYIITFLSDKYSISERKVYTVINRFSKDCKGCAV